MTVATGKKIMIKSLTLRFDNEGANSAMSGRWGTAGAMTFVEKTAAQTPEATASQYLLDAVLTAGQDVRLVGDAGANNGEADYNLTYQELPA